MNRVHLSFLLATLGALSGAIGCGEGAEPDYGDAGSPVLPGPTGGAGAAVPGGTVVAPTAGAGATFAGGGVILPPAPPTTGGGLPPNPPAGTAGGLTAGGVAAGGAAGGRAGGILAGGIIAGLTGGAGGIPGFTGGGGGMTGGTPAEPLPPVTGGTEPKIPAPMGTCPEMKNGTVMVAGHRGVQLTVGAANKMGPIYFFWHGTGGSASQVSMVPAAVRNEVISLGGIIASFNGSSSSGTDSDCSGTAAHNKADFKAADEIVACGVKNHGADPRRIYTTGCSAGGLQSGCMAQLRSSYIAAAAPNSGGVVFPERWQDAGKPAIFSMHGGSSDWVIVTFSETSAALNQAAKSHGSFVVNCDHGGGHCAAPSALYTASWEFMKAHPYGVESPWKGGIPASAKAPAYCKIF